jgi:hypothetical protein
MAMSPIPRTTPAVAGTSPKPMPKPVPTPMPKPTAPLVAPRPALQATAGAHGGSRVPLPAESIDMEKGSPRVSIYTAGIIGVICAAFGWFGGYMTKRPAAAGSGTAVSVRADAPQVAVAPALRRSKDRMLNMVKVDPDQNFYIHAGYERFHGIEGSDGTVQSVSAGLLLIPRDERYSRMDGILDVALLQRVNRLYNERGVQKAIGLSDAQVKQFKGMKRIDLSAGVEMKAFAPLYNSYRSASGTAAKAVAEKALLTWCWGESDAFAHQMAADLERHTAMMTKEQIQALRDLDAHAPTTSGTAAGAAWVGEKLKRPISDSRSCGAITLLERQDGEPTDRRSWW